MELITHCCSSPWLSASGPPTPLNRPHRRLQFSSQIPEALCQLACPRTAHHGARTQSTEASHKQRRAEPTDKSCQNRTALQSYLHLPAGQQACVINPRNFTRQMLCLLVNLSRSLRCKDILTSHSLPVHDDTKKLMNKNMQNTQSPSNSNRKCCFLKQTGS